MTTEHTIRNGDVDLHVVESGDAAGPPILVLHGITGSTATWDWLMPHLEPGHRVVRLDFRGHGGSGRAPGTYDMPSYLSDAVAVCEFIGQPSIVIGHSLGGATAAALAQQRPELVRALVLEDPPLAIGKATLEGNSLLDAFRMMRQTIPILQEQRLQMEQLLGLLAAAPNSTGRPFGEVLEPDAIRAMAVALMQVDAAVLDPVLDGRVTAAYDPDRPIPVPTLILAADPASPDAVVRPADVEQLARVSPDTKVRVVAGASHLIHDELATRQVLLDAVLEFIGADVAA